jgi:F-type H+-transporting ATPase subunit delta
MAEISTIARPYAEALFAAAKESEHPETAHEVESILSILSTASEDPLVKVILDDPKVSDQEVVKILREVLPNRIPSEAEEFLKLVVGNGKFSAISEIARQYGLLLDKARGEAEVVIESPFPLNEKQLEELVASLGKKFPGLTLKPTVVLDKSLIGGVRVSVGDQVLDGTVKTRLAEMQAALTR